MPSGRCPPSVPLSRAACEVIGGVTAAGSAPPGPAPFGPVPHGVLGVLAAQPVLVLAPPSRGGQRVSGRAGNCEGKVSSWKGGGWERRCPAGRWLWAGGDREAARRGSSGGVAETPGRCGSGGARGCGPRRGLLVRG